MRPLALEAPAPRHHASAWDWRATERKRLPDVEVAAAGGWTQTDSLKQCYQQADEATMLDISFQLSAISLQP